MCRIYQSVILLALTVMLGACGDSGSGGDGKVAVSAISTTDTTETLSDSARFDKGFRKKGCEILSAELAGETFGYPAADLKQTKVLGCIYTWSSESEKFEAAISMIQAHKSESGAATWFAKATRNKTAEEVKAEIDRVAEKVREKVGKNDGSDTTATKSATEGIFAMLDSKAVNFEEVAALGDEARVSDDGSVTVRVDNLTFSVSAYQGAVAPALDLKGADTKEIIKVAKKHDEDWAKKTAPQRKKDGVKLAKAIVATL